MDQSKTKKPWYKSWWAITLFIFIGIGILGSISDGTDTSTPSTQDSNLEEKDYVLEMTKEQVFDEFSGLSEIQTEEKVKDFKGKRIKTSVFAGKIDGASLSTGYVVMDNEYYPEVKAFFPRSEKEKLLEANVGDTIIFSGEFAAYSRGFAVDTVEFINSKVIEINSTK